MEKLYDALRAFACGRVVKDEPMRCHTTFRVGGSADICLFPASVDEVKRALDLCPDALIVGNGSNLLVKDGGVRGLVIILGENFSDISVEGNVITAQAGALLSKIAGIAMENSLTGLEFASGIPGTVGGGTAMNAGAYGGQLSDVLQSAKVLSGGEVREYSLADMEMGYRTTRPLREKSIILESTFVLQSGVKEDIAAAMRDLNARRREKQPLNLPSAGSTFKRPAGYFAGALIEQAGLKGACVGGAAVSEKHAGFIVNKGGATARDILDLIDLVKKRVLENSGVELETEIRIVGED